MKKTIQARFIFVVLILIVLAEGVLKKCLEEGGNRFRSSRD
ncbi:hypothetical protein [Candidatus Hakubella thermalkaliphila]|nr:hypothetical protein [Candidatus Hakubella thermalkaliphila]